MNLRVSPKTCGSPGELSLVLPTWVPDNGTSATLFPGYLTALILLRPWEAAHPYPNEWCKFMV